MIKKVCVVGAGTMGNGIAHVFALHSFTVYLLDINTDQLKAGIENIHKNLHRQRFKGSISEIEEKNAIDHLFPTTEASIAFQNADLVVEAVSENLKIKQTVLHQADQLCPSDVILASNTSSISILELARGLTRPENVIGMHFMNPVPLMPLVEVIKTKHTSSFTLDTVLRTCEIIGKTAVPSNDFPGFVANRILMPMLNEAIITLEDGVAGVQEIDDIMRLGMAHQMGPLLLADFIGLDVCHAILEVMQKGLNSRKYQPANLLSRLVKEGKLGKKTGEGFYSYSSMKEIPPAPKSFDLST